jgi:hypothetical protein
MVAEKAECACDGRSRLKTRVHLEDAREDECAGFTSSAGFRSREG